MKRWPTPLVTTEMQIETRVRYFLTSMKMAMAQKIITNVGKGVEELEPLYIAGGSIKWCNYFGKQFGSSSES